MRPLTAEKEEVLPPIETRLPEREKVELVRKRYGRLQIAYFEQILDSFKEVNWLLCKNNCVLNCKIMEIFRTRLISVACRVAKF